MKKVFLSIAGSDPFGGAGIQADTKVATLLGLYPCSVITAITAQNSQNVEGVWDVSKKLLEKQLESVLTDVIPDAVKIGLLLSPDAVKLVSDILVKYNVRNIVVDPVLSLTLSKSAASKSLIKAYFSYLFPIATLVTPNLPEKKIFEETLELPLDYFCKSYLLKGGHSENETIEDILKYHSEEETDDIIRDSEEMVPSIIASSTPFPTIEAHPLANLATESETKYYGEIKSKVFRHPRINTKNTHGSGCVLSSAIACYLANGENLLTAISHAIDFTESQMRLSADINFGKGEYGPVLI